MKVRLMILSVLSVAVSLTSVQATELPPAPQGYQWADCPEIKGAFLQPDGWHFKKGMKGETWGILITKENVDVSGTFTTGLTINVIPHIPAKAGMSPSKYAAEYVKTGIASRKVVGTPWSRAMGPFESFGVVLSSPDPIKGDFITHNLAIGNDTTGTFYLMVLPERVWVTTTGSGWARMGNRHQAAIRRESSRAEKETAAWKTGSCTRSCWASSSHG